MDRLIAIENLTKTFGKRRVLSDVSFVVNESEVLGLIGPNGAGKTTLFECLSGLLPVVSGRVTYREQLLAPSNRKNALFYFPDGITPWSEQTVTQMLQFFRQLYSCTSARLEELTAVLRLGELLKARVGTLSKGERKRVVLGLGLLTPRPLLLLDDLLMVWICARPEM